MTTSKFPRDIRDFDAAQIKIEAPCQRWRERRALFRDGEGFAPELHAVDVIDRNAARAFVLTHHYAASYPSNRLNVGLYRGLELAGVATFSVPSRHAVKARTGLSPEAGVELGRFVLLDKVEANGETWFLARAFEFLRASMPDLKVVLSYSDPVERISSDGRIVMPGHVGTIYQAHNARYLGKTKPRTMLLSPTGHELPPRSFAKIRNGERGDGAAYDRLIALGAPKIRPREAPAAYVARVRSCGAFRSIAHGGCHCYAWPLDRRVRLPAGLAYPKKHALP